jgi:hypothetical protein
MTVDKFFCNGGPSTADPQTPALISGATVVWGLLSWAAMADSSRPRLPFRRRGGRAVDRAGLENRKAERSREFESHPLRHFLGTCASRTKKHNISAISGRNSSLSGVFRPGRRLLPRRQLFNSYCNANSYGYSYRNADSDG